MKYFLACIFIFLSLISFSQKKIEALSPDRNISFTAVATGGVPHYSISLDRKIILENCSIGFSFPDVNFENFKMLKPSRRTGLEKYTLMTGKSSQVTDPFNEIVIPLQDIIKHISIDWIVRVFNDGVAFRFVYKSVMSSDSLVLTDETPVFNFKSDPIIRTLLLPNFTSSHEGLYTTSLLSKLQSDELMDMPALFEIQGIAFVAITESALANYAGMYLKKHNGAITGVLSPLPGQQSVKVKASFPHASPWRVIMISSRVGALIESNMITSLADPPANQDFSWLRPGKTTFPWWNGNVVPDTLNAPGNNFVTQQYYIDFCARNNIAYHTVVEYGLHQWYQDDGTGFQPGRHPDVLKPVPGLDMKEVCDYARSKGVGVRVWVHWKALYLKLDSAFAKFEEWGLQGMMIDFMDRDDQEMVNIQQQMLRKAAAHHLHIQFHGAYKPTGNNRTWPNEFTREGTLNYEINKWDSKGLSPDHDIMIPFTRLIAGSTDYHLGGFRAAPDGQYRQQYTRPLTLGTRCHMLAMYVVLENPLAMVCDYPDAYEGQAGFDFIKQVPTTWDETKVIDAKIGEYVVIARRKGPDWYVGAITNHEARDISVPFNFLNVGNYDLKLYSDAENTATDPNQLAERLITIGTTDHREIHLAKGGGFVMMLKKR